MRSYAGPRAELAAPPAGRDAHVAQAADTPAAVPDPVIVSAGLRAIFAARQAWALRAPEAETDEILADAATTVERLRGERLRWENATDYWRHQHEQAAADLARYRKAFQQARAERAALRERLRPWWVRLRARIDELTAELFRR